MEIILNADILILLVLAFSMLRGLLQSFLQTVLSLFDWFVASSIAAIFLHDLSNFLIHYSSILEIRLMIAFISLLCSSLLLSSWLTHLLMQTVATQKKSSIEFVLSALFGFLQGTLLILACVIIFALTPLKQASWWHSSELIAYFSILSHQISGFP